MNFIFQIGAMGSVGSSADWRGDTDVSFVIGDSLVSLIETPLLTLGKILRRVYQQLIRKIKRFETKTNFFCFHHPVDRYKRVCRMSDKRNTGFIFVRPPAHRGIDEIWDESSGCANLNNRPTEITCLLNEALCDEHSASALSHSHIKNT